MIYSFGDVLLVPFLSNDQSKPSKRPVIVISSSSCNQRHENLIVIAVTSNSKATLSPDSLVISDWQRAGLQGPSLVKPVVKTLPHNSKLKEIGSLLYKDKQALQKFLTQIIGMC